MNTNTDILVYNYIRKQYIGNYSIFRLKICGILQQIFIHFRRHKYGLQFLEVLMVS